MATMFNTSNRATRGFFPEAGAGDEAASLFSAMEATLPERYDFGSILTLMSKV
jgi:hypothetical protein